VRMEMKMGRVSSQRRLVEREASVGRGRFGERWRRSELTMWFAVGRWWFAVFVNARTARGAVVGGAQHEGSRRSVRVVENIVGCLL